MFSINRLFKLGITANILSVLLFSFTLPVKAWGPKYEYGVCDINTGMSKQRTTFHCFIERGGGVGMHYQRIRPEVGIGVKGSELLTIATYYPSNPNQAPTKVVNWADGSEDKITGERYQGEEWTIWIKRGWAISFHPPRNEDL